MANESNAIDTLIEGLSFEELVTIKDNLEKDFDKETEKLKSIVKEKYQDIVDASDAIQSMKISLKHLEQSMWSLDKSISEFYIKIKEPQTVVKQTNDSGTKLVFDVDQPKHDQDVNLLMKLLDLSADLWDNFDQGNMKMCVKLLNEATQLFVTNCDKLCPREKVEVERIFSSFIRAKEMIKNNLWHKVLIAAPDQIGIIAGSDQEDLYNLSLNSSIEFLVQEFRQDLFDTSFQAQIRRYQPYSYFNSHTNEINVNIDDRVASKTLPTGYIQIPKFTSPELNTFLYKVCEVINKIAGYNLNRTSIVDSLKITIERAMEAYSDAIPFVGALKAETKRKRALQLYFDLLYLRILLNTSKSTNLIEKLDPIITGLASKFETMLDSIELYMVSSALHSNVMNLSQSTIRFYGLLIPRLQ